MAEACNTAARSGRAAVVLLACLLAGCAGPNPEQAQREAAALLDEVSAAVAVNLTPLERGGPAQVQQCAWLPEWPTSKRAWELWRTYASGGAESAERVARLVEHARSAGGTVVFEGQDSRGGRRARVTMRGLDVFATGGSGLELRVRSRCFTPETAH